MRCTVGVAVLVIACGGSATDGRNRAETDAGGGADGGGSPGTGGVSGNAGTASGGAGTGGADPTDAGDPCGPGGCIGSTDASPIPPPGPVLCGGTECAAPRACCLGTGVCFDPSTEADLCPQPPPDGDLWGRTPCASNAHCQDRQFCSLESGLCQGTGHCNPIGNCGSCTGGDACRVCGCDGNTYPDIQTACLAGASVVAPSGGGCGETISIGGGGAGGEVRLVTPCGTSDDCSQTDLCCSITGRCYPASDPDQCRLPPLGTSFPCTSNLQCEANEYCYAADGCSTPGGCVRREGEDCGVTLEPVCGCDDTTYTSAACASSRGVRVAYTGECGSTN
jgi:hypothetical protein